jgi:hypothetical protein
VKRALLTKRSSLLTGLVAYWKLDEASGTRFDSAGSNHLTDNATVTQAAGIISNAAEFTAANSESLSILDNAALSMGDIDFTVDAWVYLTDKTAIRAVLAKWNNSANHREYLLWYNNSTDRFIFSVSNDGTAQGVATADNLGSPSLNTWYYIHAEHDAALDKIRISVNNGTPNETAWTTGVLDSDSTFRIGANSQNIQHFNGRIDECGVWKRLLSAVEKASRYNGGAGLSYPF